MKRLEELGISPAPWFITKHGEIYSQQGFIFGIKRVEFGCRVVFTTDADARLIAASPKMYSAGYDLLTYLEEWMRLYPPSEWSTMGQAFQLLEEAQDELRAALAEAAGEEVSDGK